MATAQDIETVILLKSTYDVLIEKIQYLADANHRLSKGIIGEFFVHPGGTYQGMEFSGRLTSASSEGGFGPDLIEIDRVNMSQIISRLFEHPLDCRGSLGEDEDFGLVRLRLEKMDISAFDSQLPFWEPINEGDAGIPPNY